MSRMAKKLQALEESPYEMPLFGALRSASQAPNSLRVEESGMVPEGPRLVFEVLGCFSGVETVLHNRHHETISNPQKRSSV